MTDRELLELAAKAAGYSVSFSPKMTMQCDNGPYYTHDRGYPGECRPGSHWWNPLLDDGDALRLAVKLRIGVICHGATVVTLFDKTGDLGTVPQRRTMVVSGSDEMAATRRAIVRAAAEIGSGMRQAEPATSGLPEDNYYKSESEAQRAAAAGDRP